jgi:putative hydrolase of the HAD superfamily
VISALISDFGGVLTTPLIRGFLAYQEQAGVTVQELGATMARSAEEDGVHPLYALERGEISEAEFQRRLESRLDGRFDFEHLRRLYFERLEPNREMIEFVRDLRGRGLRTALCTNNVREWEPLWRSKLPPCTVTPRGATPRGDEVFEVVVDSAFVGSRKPEREIYDITLERLGGVKPQECVFVDDIDVNCEGARELGMHPVRFEETSRAIAEVEALLSSGG